MGLINKLSVLKKSDSESVESGSDKSATISKGASWSKEKIVHVLTGVNYNAVIKAVGFVAKFKEYLNAAIPSLNLLKKASDNYKTSESEVKDQEFFDFIIANLDAQLLLDTLEPISDSIPMGSELVFALKMLLELKNKK